MSSNKEGLFTVYVIFCQPTLISECKTTSVHRNCYKMSHSHEKDEVRNRTRGGGNELSTFFDRTKTSVMAITFCACCCLAFLLNHLFICQTAKKTPCLGFNLIFHLLLELLARAGGKWVLSHFWIFSMGQILPPCSGWIVLHQPLG